MALRDKVQAAIWLADRAFGKPPQTVTVANVEREQLEEIAVALQGARNLPGGLKNQTRARGS